MRKKIKTRLYVIMNIFILLIIDLMTKTYFTGKHYFIDKLIYISYSENTGSSFGIFSGISFYPYMIIFLSFLFLATLVHYKDKILKNKITTCALIFIFAGVLGNTYDRAFYGFVRDFIGLKYLFIFNLADLYISLSFVLYLIYEWQKRDEKKE